MIHYSHSAAETQKIAAGFAKTVKSGSVIGLYGDLGAGKTTFVQGMARGLGVGVAVTSPTFTLVNDYGPLIHVDLYRIEQPKEIETLGLEEYRDRILVIEWAEKWNGVDFRVSIKDRGGEERKIEII